MDNVTKVLFPVISRLQEDKNKVGRVVEKILYYETALLLPVMILAFFAMPKLVLLIPRYTKWLPALPFFYIFVISTYFVIYSSPFINIFNALGKVKLSFSFMLAWTVIMWILTPILTRLFVYYGFPFTHLFISLTFFFVVIVAKKNINFQFFRPIKKFILSSIPMILVILFVNSFVTSNLIFTLVTMVLAGGLTYFIFVRYFFKIDPLSEIKYLFNIR